MKYAKWTVVLAMLGVVALSTQARELAVPEDELLVVELATVALVPGTNAPVVLLREPDSGEIVPIFIGHEEARAILLALRGIDPPRPMSHDLMLDLVSGLSADVERVVVDELREGTYLGAVELRERNGEARVRIDARPSDALALAVRAGAEIRVSAAVLRAGSGIEFEGLGRDQVVTALGITVVEATDDLRAALGLPEKADGVLVSAAGGLAASLGVRPGALITLVNQGAPSDPMRFLEAVQGTPQGGRVEIEFWIDGDSHVIDLPADVPRRGPRVAL